MKNHLTKRLEKSYNQQNGRLVGNRTLLSRSLHPAVQKPRRKLIGARWPDNDEPGLAYAKKVAALALDAGVTSVAIITLPEDKPKGWDIADAIEDGWMLIRRLN